MISAVKIAMCAALGCVSLNSELVAQTVRESRDSTLAQTCQARAKDFARSPAAAEVFLLAECGVTGPRVLTEAWRSLSVPDSAALLQLMRTSAVLPAASLAQVLLERAEDTSSPLVVRSAAVATLAAFLDRSYSPTVGRNYTKPSVLVVGLSRRSHGYHNSVVDPVDEALMAQIRARLGELAGSSVPYSLQALAKRASGIHPG